MNGADVCRMHGAKAPQVLAASQRRIQTARAVEAVATYGLSVEIDPFDALTQEIARTNGHVLWLADIVAGLEQQAIVWGQSSTEEQASDDWAGTYRKSVEQAGINVWVDLYQKERRHLVDVCKTAIACGLASHEVELAEEQAKLIAAMIRKVFGDPVLGLTEEQQETARKVIARHLRALPRAP